MNHLSSHRFEYDWNHVFPQKLPIGHLFKYYFYDKWLRIYSLPDAKRYADDKIELEQLLLHQNQIISDCFGSETHIYIVSGHYSYGDIETPKINYQNSLSNYDFKVGTAIHLHTKEPTYFDDGENNDQYFTPHFVQSIWRKNLHNELLIKIANDEFDAFFVCFENNIIIAPYDGGIDLIVPEQDLTNHLKRRYTKYLSSREDGL